ncbi:hypothetical protein AYO42_02040 [Rhizomicrobium sp. SCGC AG-212-E05]|nr:hypothetical protein AYO42_02040 [Rhizomicrobium sp. SCGC AG-212-E05]
MRAFVMTAAAAFFPITMLASQALAVQDTPTTINGVETVCTGVGSAKDDPRWGSYPVKIVLATTGGANLANAHVSISRNGKDVAGLDCDAPWVLFRPAAGSYTATATLKNGGGTTSQNFTTDGNGPQKEITLTFPRPSNTAASQ